MELNIKRVKKFFHSFAIVWWILEGILLSGRSLTLLPEYKEIFIVGVFLIIGAFLRISRKCEVVAIGRLCAIIYTTIATLFLLWLTVTNHIGILILVWAVIIGNILLSLIDIFEIILFWYKDNSNGDGSDSKSVE